MKFIQTTFLTGALLFLFQWVGVSIPSYSSPEDYAAITVINKKKERVLLKEAQEYILELIDLRCLDTWCEGITRYNFHTFQCYIDKGKCFFAYESQIRDKEAVEYECTLEMKSLDPIVDSIKGDRLSDELYIELGICIDGIKYY